MESRIDLCSKGSLLQMLFGGLMLMVMCLQLYQVHFGAFFFYEIPREHQRVSFLDIAAE